MINLRWATVDALAVTITPPFGWRANAATARSIPLMSVGSITLNSTPDEEAMV